MQATRAKKSPAFFGRLLFAALLPISAAHAVDFHGEIQPIFAAKCLSCHGAAKQKGDFRLDIKAVALRGGDSGRVIVPGNSAGSNLIHLVEGREANKVMPPTGDRLSDAQVTLLRRWIDEGAPWPDSAKPAETHWSLQPFREPPVPKTATPVSNAIDAFVMARLEKEGLRPAPPADRRTLIRRLYFDLIGLPPSPTEVDGFVESKAPRAYEDLVERLLASPQYGERWGRHWLDVARYTESQGFEYDRLRDNAWHYRDYVIRSFNEDKPYDRFMQEQIAGDVMSPVKSEGIIAASLLVCGPWDQAGSSQANATQRALTREDEMEDLLGTVGQGFLGLTINCARCHAHKFDPISHEEYYRVKAVFDGVKHGERPIADPVALHARQAKKAALDNQISAAQEQISRIENQGEKRALALRRPAAERFGPAPLLRWNFTGENAPQGKLNGGALQANDALQLPKEGAFFQSQPIARDIREKTLEAWVALDKLEQGGGAVISLETEDGAVFDALTFGERQPQKWAAGSENFRRTRDLDAPSESTTPGTFLHVAIVYQSDGRIALFRNGEPYGQPYTPGPLLTFKAGKAHVVLGLRHKGGGRPWLTGAIKQAALYDHALSNEEIALSFRAAGLAIPRDAILAALTPAETAARNAALAEIKRASDELTTLDAVPVPVSYVGTRVQPPVTRRLKRGDVNSPDETVKPGALSAIVTLNPDFGLSADAPEAQRRLKFAEWLADARNPLPARVMANRIWHYHFGQGLVATPSDFGASGARPSHPEMLDYLAAKFIAGGWSVKNLHRLIVTSATYKQSSAFDAKAAAKDADNVLLWRFAPRRLEAESLRDAMLSVSGELNLQMGGPSFRPFIFVAFPTNAYVPADKIGPEFNRRTVYRMNVNSGKDPLLDAFDCPDPSVKTPRRGSTTTPLQALELMNNSFVQRQAQRLAQRALRESPNDLPGAIQIAYRITFGRNATNAEAARAATVAAQHGFDGVCWVLLNSTEFVYVR